MSIFRTKFDVKGIVDGVETDLIHESNGTTVKNGVSISVEGKVVQGKLEQLINGNSKAMYNYSSAAETYIKNSQSF